MTSSTENPRPVRDLAIGRSCPRDQSTPIGDQQLKLCSDARFDARRKLQLEKDRFVEVKQPVYLVYRRIGPIGSLFKRRWSMGSGRARRGG